MLFLDTLMSQGPSYTLTTIVYHKPSHRDQYLHCNSNHFLAAKHSVHNTLTHRARVVCTGQLVFQKEESHIRQALLKCNFSPLALNNLHIKFHHRLITDHTHMADYTAQQQQQELIPSSFLFQGSQWKIQ